MKFAFLQDLLIAAIFFVPLERLLTLRKYQGIIRDGLAVDLAHILVNGMLVTYGIASVMLLAMMLEEQLIPQAWQMAIASQPLALQFVEILLVADLIFYLVHRAFHRVPFLWRFHAVHHSIERMDWIAAHRIHPVDQIVTKSASLVPVFALGFEPVAIAAYAIVFQWHTLLTHANARVDFGPLRWVLASPLFHHWHHANHADAVDKNFAPQLPVWDMIFGTLFLPDRDMPETYGTDYPMPKSYVGQVAHPFLWAGPSERHSKVAASPRATAQTPEITS